MTVIAIDCFVVKLPVRRQHRWATLTDEIGRYVLVRLRTETGVDGWGEATALPQWGGSHGRYYGEDPKTVLHLIETYWAPLLLGAEPADWKAVSAKLHFPVRGYPFARAAIESALLDARARAVGVPVSDLLGGRGRTLVPIAHSIGLLPETDVVTEAEQAMAEGARAIKLKVGEDRVRDVSVVRAVRRRVGAEVALAVDANQGWGSALDALAVLRELEGVGLRYAEQPVEGMGALAQVANGCDTPIMADESAWVPEDLVAIGEQPTPMLASIYIGKAGGISNALRADAVAGVLGIGTNVNGSGETGVGNLANLHLAAAMTSLAEACVLPVTGLDGRRDTAVVGAMYRDDVLSEPFRYRDGHVTVPSGPGWGIDVDEDKVDAYCTDRLTIHQADSGDPEPE